jgi:hypothetical protein
MEKKAKYIAFYQHKEGPSIQFHTSNAFDMDVLVKALGQNNISMLSVEGMLHPKWGQLYDFITFDDLEKRLDKEEIHNSLDAKQLNDLWNTATDLHNEHLNEVDYHMSDNEREASWDAYRNEWYDKAFENYRRNL